MPKVLKYFFLVFLSRKGSSSYTYCAFNLAFEIFDYKRNISYYRLCKCIECNKNYLNISQFLNQFSAHIVLIFLNEI